MKIPKASTIRGKIHAYARKVGLTVMHNVDGSYNIWDNRIAYYTHKNVNMDTVVRVVIDDLYAIKFRQEASLSVGA